ncbi:hypothetical protein [Streptomyces sp. NPDC127092]|uniref:hypothetical protein n=1 Tax=Streptomyces sp. NPDC127092 TaxID=3347135 RepID=UPI0036504240
MTSSTDGQAPEKTYATTVRPAKLPDVVVVPREVVTDAKLSLADLGLWVKLASWTHVDIHLDAAVKALLAGDFGRRVDVDEASLRAGVQRLIDAGLLTVDSAEAKRFRAEGWGAHKDQDAFLPSQPPRPA